METLKKQIERQERLLKAARLKKERQRNEIVLAALAEDPIKREERRQVLHAWHRSAVKLGDTLDRIIVSLEEKKQA